MSRPVHFEIHAGDMERAEKFYSTVFGWKFVKWDGPVPYTLIYTDPEYTDMNNPSPKPGVNGGLVERKGPAPEDGQPMNGWAMTMEVENLDAILEKVLAGGGKMALEKMEMPGVGWMAYCKDTEGNIFGLLQPAKPE